MVSVSNRVGKVRAHRPRLGSEMVLIYVGIDLPPIQVHRNIILQSSEFFKKALNSSFCESSGVVRLPEQPREWIELYVEWVYFGTIVKHESDSKKTSMLNRSAQLYDLYLLAEILQDQSFANSVMDALISESDGTADWPTGLAASAWAELPANSLMRKYIKELWVTQSLSEWFGHKTGDITDAPKDFWIEIAQLYTLIREKKEKVPKPSWTSRCRYHSHKGGHTCA